MSTPISNEIPQSYWIETVKMSSSLFGDSPLGTTFKEGSKFGYHLRDAEVEKLNAENLRLSNELADAKVLIRKAFESGSSELEDVKFTYKLFCETNNIQP